MAPFLEHSHPTKHHGRPQAPPVLVVEDAVMPRRKPLVIAVKHNPACGAVPPQVLQCAAVDGGAMPDLALKPCPGGGPRIIPGGRRGAGPSLGPS